MKKLIVIAGLLTGMFSCSFAQTEDTLEKYEASLLKPGTAAPDFRLETPDGGVYTLGDFKGKYLVLDFWAAWCKDCIASIPEVSEAHRRFQPKGVVFLGVSLDDNRENWINTIDSYKLEYLHGSEMKKWRKTDIAPAYAIDWIPTFYIIGKDGKVILGTAETGKLVKKLEELTGE